MGLVVELERVIGVREVLVRLSFDFSVGFDPVKKLCALARVFFHRILISFQRFVMPGFLGQRSLATVARNVFREIVAASESRGIELPPVKAVALRTAPPIIIAILAI